MTTTESLIYIITQILGAQIDQVPFWLCLPTTTLYKILMKKKESMQGRKPKTADISFKSQADAERAWLKETQSKEVLQNINFNTWRI